MFRDLEKKQIRALDDGRVADNVSADDVELVEKFDDVKILEAHKEENFSEKNSRKKATPKISKISTNIRKNEVNSETIFYEPSAIGIVRKTNVEKPLWILDKMIVSSMAHGIGNETLLGGCNFEVVSFQPGMLIAEG